MGANESVPAHGTVEGESLLDTEGDRNTQFRSAACDGIGHTRHRLAKYADGECGDGGSATTYCSIAATGTTSARRLAPVVEDEMSIDGEHATMDVAKLQSILAIVGFSTPYCDGNDDGNDDDDDDDDAYYNAHASQHDQELVSLDDGVDPTEDSSLAMVGPLVIVVSGVESMLASVPGVRGIDHVHSATRSLTRSPTRFITLDPARRMYRVSIVLPSEVLLRGERDAVTIVVNDTHTVGDVRSHAAHMMGKALEDVSVMSGIAPPPRSLEDDEMVTHCVYIRRTNTGCGWHW